jgi:hypothetical protein
MQQHETCKMLLFFSREAGPEIFGKECIGGGKDP